MAEFEKNITEEEVEEQLENNIVTLTDEETGEEADFELYARATIDDKDYFALVPCDENSDEYVILRATIDGEDMLFETIDDDDEFEKVEEYFNDLLFNEVDYDEN
jgi:uncharacterized protein YrzB (UPF0473 family)